MDGRVERLYRRLGRRYLLAYRIGYLASGVALCLAACTTFTLVYQDISFTSLLALIGVAELFIVIALGWGALLFMRVTQPIEDWIGGRRDPEAALAAWQAALDAPSTALRQQLWRAVLLAAVPVTSFAAIAFDLQALEVAILLVAIVAAAVYPTLLNFFGLELYMRPVVREVAAHLPAEFEVPQRLGLQRRLFLGVPLITAANGVFISVYSTTSGTPTLQQLGLDLAVVLVLSSSMSLVLALLLAHTILGPVEELLAATRRIKAGDLATRANVTSADELGTLTLSFNEMTADLQRSRERLVGTREEERRRLRADLHDGVGPTLAGITLQLDAAQNVLRGDPAHAERLLEHARGEVQTAIADLRRLVYGLRPPALDELGLVRAIEQRAASFSFAGADGQANGSLRIEVAADDLLPELSAAVEVAAFRIIEEALTNTVRHAHASRCAVAIHAAEALEVAIEDDGIGLSDAHRPGVGLGSMRERAAEVGGSCTIARRSNGGTAVRARLPLGTPVGSVGLAA